MAGLPEPQKVEVAPTTNREHGDFQSNVALALQKQVGARGPRSRHEFAERSSRPRRRHVDRIEVAGPGFLNFFLLADVAARRAARRSSRPARSTAAATTYQAPADQPRVRLGEPDRAAARGRRPLGRGRRRDRQPARGAGCRGAPGVLPERRRQPARQRSVHRCTPATRARRCRRTATRASTSSTWRERLRAELGDDVTEEEAREWGLHDVVEQLQDDLGRIGVHFDTWFSERTLHERGEVAAVLERLKLDGVTYEHEGAHVARGRGSRRPARPGPREVRRQHDVPLQRPRVPPRQVRSRAGTHLIDIWGADHHGQVKSVQVGMEALGVGTGTSRSPRSSSASS